MGFGTVLVREPEGNRSLEDAVFWTNLGVAVAAFAVLVVVRPLLAHAFDPPLVASLLAAYALRLMVMAGSVVPEARMRRALRFHELSVIRVIAGLADNAAKLAVAYLGAHGTPELRVWCFAVGPIVNAVVTAIAIQVRCPWRPRLAFDRTEARRATRFTAALSGGELLYYVYTSADYLVIGAAFGDAAVGAYRLAYELVLDVVRLISMITAEVAFPVFAQTARAELPVAFLRFTRQNLIVLAPFLVFASVEADRLLALLYGALPDSAGTAARILCVVGALRSLGFVVPPLLAALGRASRVLAYNAVAAVLLPTAFVLAARLGSDYTAVAWAWAAGYPLAFALLLGFALPAIGLAPVAYARALAGPLVCAAGAAATGLALHGVPLGLAGLGVAASYLGLLALVLGITPRSLVRDVRGAPAAPAPGTAPPPGT
jgi:O-antigen/teichoic acid export membrane protein